MRFLGGLRRLPLPEVLLCVQVAQPEIVAFGGKHLPEAGAGLRRPARLDFIENPAQGV